MLDGLIPLPQNCALKTMKVENHSAPSNNEAAIAELLKDSEKLRTDMKKLINTLTIRIIVVVGLGFAVLALILK